MKQRKIQRIAFLQDYRNRPESLVDEIPEVAGLGYHEITVSARIGEEGAVAELARKAGGFGLEVSVFTGFMKYEQAYLRQHPEQKVVFNRDADREDMENLPPVWGCPFNEVFQKRYFDFLERLGRIPNLTEVWVNDEAFLGRGEDVLACYCRGCQEDWEREFGGRIPMPPFKDLEEKARLINWRFGRWNEVHGQMKKVLDRHHKIRAVFQTSPMPYWDINPWVSGIDFGGMVEAIDGLATDAYHTAMLPAVGSGLFTPIEIFLSECCRFIRGFTSGKDKVGVMIAQGMSHPEFSRPLDERDGWWAAVVPPALGVDRVTTFTYRLQRVSPMHRTYQEAFRLDPYFAQTEPVEFVAVIDSLETQCYDAETPATGRGNWRLSRMMALGATAGQYGLPYVYLPSSRLSPEELERFPVVILPNVSCLSARQRAALQGYVKSGGTLVAAGETGTRDEAGRPSEGSFLRDVFGIVSCVPEHTSRQFSATGEHEAFADLPWPDEITGRDSWKGNPYPVLGLDHVVRVEAGGDAEALAVFKEEEGPAAGRPAITTKQSGKGYGVFLAGIPSRWFTRRPVGTTVLSLSRQVVSQLILSLAGEKLPIRARRFPPKVPLQEVRPLDLRWKPTVEFLPSVGDDLYLVTAPSYFKEPGEFQIEVRLPDGKRCREVRELVSDQPVTASRKSGQTVEIDVRFASEDFLKIFAFFLE